MVGCAVLCWCGVVLVLCVYMWCCVVWVASACACGVVVRVVWWCVWCGGVCVCGMGPVAGTHGDVLNSLFLFFLLSFLLPSLLFSSLHANKNCTELWTTNTASNFEAFECDVAHGTFIATANDLPGMFPPLLPLLFSPSSLPPTPRQKKGLFITGIFPARELFCITVLY